MSDKARREYRCRIVRISKYWKEHCPVYYNIGVKEVSDEELNDPTKFYYGRYKYDFAYSGLNVKCVLHFLMSNKSKDSRPILRVPPAQLNQPRVY